MKYFVTSTHPSRVPRPTGFFLRRRFDDGADALPDGRFTPPAGVFTAPIEATGETDGCAGVDRSTAPSDLAFAASMAGSSAFTFPSASLAAVGFSTVRLAFIASRGKSACVRHA